MNSASNNDTLFRDIKTLYCTLCTVHCYSIRRNKRVNIYAFLKVQFKEKVHKLQIYQFILNVADLGLISGIIFKWCVQKEPKNENVNSLRSCNYLQVQL